MPQRPPAAGRRGRTRRPVAAAGRLLRPLLVDRVPRDHHQPDHEFRRRRVVVVAFGLVGTVLLGLSLSVVPGDPVFYVLASLMAGVWLAGGLLSGPLHLGRQPARGGLVRPVLAPVVIGLLLAGVFVVGALVVRRVPFVAGQVDDVLAIANQGVLPLVALVTALNGVAEEVFFRGGLYAALGRRRPVLVSTLLYAAATVATANPVLVLAAVLVGAVLGLQRRASGGLLAPVLTHVTWSTAMLLALPPIFGAAR